MPPWLLELNWSPGKATSIRRVEPRTIHCEHEGHAYTIRLLSGVAEAVPDAPTVRIVPGETGVVMDMSAHPA